mgnify:CR=1 FL=1
MVSVASDGTPANAASERAAMSADGRFVVFLSHATNLVPGDANFAKDVFVHDRDRDETEDRREERAGIAGLARRIDDVMRFEKVKAQWRGNRDRLPSLSRFLGRLRYPQA